MQLSQPVTNAAKKAIDAGMSDFNLGENSFHVELYVAGIKLIPGSMPCPIEYNCKDYMVWVNE